MAFNPNRNSSGNGRPNFHEPNIFDDDPDNSSYLMSMSHEPFPSTQNMFMNDFQNDFSSSRFMAPNQDSCPGASFTGPFRFNANARPFVPRTQGRPSQNPSHSFFNQTSEMSNMRMSPVRQHNSMMGGGDFGGPSNNLPMFGMPRGQPGGFPNRGANPPARRNIYGPQYSQATLDNYPMYSQGSDQMRAPNNMGFDSRDGSNFGSGMSGPGQFSNDPAQLQQQMEAAGLSVRPQQVLQFSEPLLQRLNASPLEMHFHQVAVGLEQISQDDLPENQYSDWDVAIKKCTQVLADKCRYEYPMLANAACTVLSQMVFEAVQLRPAAIKRLADLYANLVINVKYFTEKLAQELASNLHPQPRNLAGITNALTFVTFVYLKLVNFQMCPLGVAMRIIDFISSLVELKPITDEHLMPVVEVLKTVGSFLDQHDAVKKRMNAVLTNVLGYAMGCQQTVSALARVEVQEIIKIREEGWISSKYHDYQRNLIGGDALLTDDEQQWVDNEIARSTPEVNDDQIQDDFEDFLDAAARSTALGVVNSCLEEFDDMTIDPASKQNNKVKGNDGKDDNQDPHF